MISAHFQRKKLEEIITSTTNLEPCILVVVYSQLLNDVTAAKFVPSTKKLGPH